MQMAFLSRGFKNLQWYSMTFIKGPEPIRAPDFFCSGICDGPRTCKRNASVRAGEQPPVG